MLTNKQAIVSFANSKGVYIQRLARLGESLRNNSPDIDFISWIGEASLGCPLHSEVPFAFKIYAVQAAKDAGYDHVLWVDSSCFAIQSVTPVFDEIKKDGVIFQDAGHYLRTWCNDRTLDYFNITAEESESIKMIGNAGFLGFDFTSTIGICFFEQWKMAMEDGQFNNSIEQSGDGFIEHRWDMSCSSAITYKMGLSHLMKSGNEWLQYAGLYDKTLNETIIFKAQG